MRTVVPAPGPSCAWSKAAGASIMAEVASVTAMSLERDGLFNAILLVLFLRPGLEQGMGTAQDAVRQDDRPASLLPLQAWNPAERKGCASSAAARARARHASHPAPG